MRRATAAPIGILQRFVLCAALLSALDPPGGRHDELAPTCEVFLVFRFPCNCEARRQTKQDHNTSKGACCIVATMQRRPHFLALCITESTRLHLMVNDVTNHGTDSMEGDFRATHFTLVPRKHHGMVKTLYLPSCRQCLGRSLPLGFWYASWRTFYDIRMP